LAIPVLLLGLIICSIILGQLTPVLLGPSSLAHATGYLSGLIDRVFSHEISHLQAAYGVVAALMLLEGLAVLFVFLSLANGRGSSERWLHVAVYGTGFVCGLGILQRVSRFGLLEPWLSSEPGLTRINATLSDMNSLGSYLVLMLPVALALALCSESFRHRGIFWGVATAACLCLIFTGSRAAWLAGGCSLLLMGGLAIPARLYAYWGGPRVSRIAPAAYGWTVGFLIAAMLVGIALGTAMDVRLEDRTSQVKNLLWTLNLKRSLDDVLKGRIIFYKVALDMIELQPLWGVGLGRYYALFPDYASLRTDQHMRAENAHNYFLQMTAEMGLPRALVLLSALCIACAVALRRSLREGRGRGDMRRATLLLGSGSGMFAFLMTNLTGHPLLLREGQIAFWSIAALSLLLGEITSNQGRVSANTT
ncbi:MAG: O-antigen ligase family protein, partial [Acidobacteriota bacterium]